MKIAFEFTGSRAGVREALNRFFADVEAAVEQMGFGSDVLYGLEITAHFSHCVDGQRPAGERGEQTN